MKSKEQRGRCPLCGDSGLIAHDIYCACPAGLRLEQAPLDDSTIVVVPTVEEVR